MALPTLCITQQVVLQPKVTNPRSGRNSKTPACDEYGRVCAWMKKYPWFVMPKLTLTLFALLSVTTFAQPTSPNADFPVEPEVAWKFKTTQAIFSSPVIDGGVVFIGGGDSALYALEMLTGRIKWKLRTNGVIRSTVALDGERLFLAGGNGVLSCISKESGTIVWRTVFDPTAMFMAERNYDFADYYHSSPVIDSGVLFLGTGNGRMNAYSTDKGTLLWSYKAGDIIHNQPVVSAGTLYFGCFDGKVYALNTLDGRERWTFKSTGHQYFPNGEFQGSPAVAHGSVFIGARDYNFYALNSATGRAVWTRSFPRGWALSSTAQDTMLLIGTSDDRELVAIDARSGEQFWRTYLKYNIFGNCSATTGMVYVPTIWGKVFGVDKRSGRIAWEWATDGHRANKQAYYTTDETFRSDIAKILTSPSQWIQAEYKMGGIFSTPAVSGNMMIITSTEGVVYGLRRRQ